MHDDHRPLLCGNVEGFTSRLGQPANYVKLITAEAEFLLRFDDCAD